MNEIACKNIVTSGYNNGNSLCVCTHTRVCSRNITISPFRIRFTIPLLHHLTIATVTVTVPATFLLTDSGYDKHYRK